MYVVPINRQTIEYPSQIFCENKPQKSFALDPDIDEIRVLTPQHIKKDSPLQVKPTQIQTTISLNTFIAHEAGFYCQKELKHQWNCALFIKHSNNTLQCPRYSYEL